MNQSSAPLLTLREHDALLAARLDGRSELACSLDLGCSETVVEVGATAWTWNGCGFPFLDACKERTIYYWTGTGFQPAARFGDSLIKLVPTQWGPPTFEIDGIKMLPTAQVSPYDDARRKVGLIQPQGKVVLDTCGGLGYFAAWCLRGKALQVSSFEKSADVLWLRSLNPWSPEHAESQAAGNALSLTHGDILQHILTVPDRSVDAVLHDPPRFGIAGELYSQAFYGQIARVLKHKGRLFHYTGAPNKLSSRRDVAGEVAKRLQRAGFATELNGDGVLAVRVATA